MAQEAEIIDQLRGWVEAESPTQDAAAVNRVMDLAQTAWRDAGFATRRIPGRDGFGDHVAAESPWGSADAPGILILTHLDTVHEIGAFGPAFRIEGGRIYGPGALDMKGGALIALMAAREIAARGGCALPIRALATSDEEVGSPTSRALIEAEGTRAKYVLVPEPARDGGKCVTGRRGVGRYTLTAHGRAAHSGVAHADGRSAIREMARQVLAVEALTAYDRGLTLNIGRIAGGTTDNTVPEWCQAHLDVRMQDDAMAEEIDARLKALTAHDPDLRLTVEGGINRPPYTKTPGIAALLATAQEIAGEIGFALEDVFTGGGSDGSFLAGHIPTLDGIGVDGAGAHTLHEHVEIASLVPRMTLLRRLMTRLV
ncbi:MAG: M20 family metallopeptidase [Pseudomonadota bacterium]